MVTSYVIYFTASVFCMLCAMSASRDARRLGEIRNALDERVRQLSKSTGAGAVNPPKQLPYRTLENPDGDPALAVEMAESRQRAAEHERDQWRRDAERYEHALEAIRAIEVQPAYGIARQALNGDDS